MSVEFGSICPMILGEQQFGKDHFKLSGIKQLYYRMRSLLPSFFRPLLHRIAKSQQENAQLLNWPIEDRFVSFLFETMKESMKKLGEQSLSYVHFWPHGKRFAFVITHDIETKVGQDYAWDLVEIDKKYGFRSSFNFVPEGYGIDFNLIEKLKQNGFEVGIHGLKHDGKLFLSKEIFDSRANKINHYLKEWDVVGFRAPLTHRNPEWMQNLEIAYDTSFFDTDPYEPIPGGTMSIWPFQMGHFIELPYTLAQDHTLMSTLGETSPQLWLDKVDFIRQYCGMALVNVHPDYQIDPAHLSIYEDFLGQMRMQKDYWHALPKEVAQWWRRRSQLDLTNINQKLTEKLPGATIGNINLVEDKIELVPST